MFNIRSTLSRAVLWFILSTGILILPFLNLTILKGAWIVKFNLFAIGGLTLSISTFLLCIILNLYGRARLHQLWLIFNFVVCLWGLGAFILAGVTKPVVALSFCRIIYVPIIFIPVLNYHVVYELCNLREKKVLFFVYFQAVIFSFLSLFFTQFIISVKFIYNSFYYTQGGPLFWVFLTAWFLIVAYSYVKLYQTFLGSSGRLRIQILYFFFGTMIGFLGGASNFLPAIGINVYPVGNFTVPLYCIIVTYAILRYQILDITITITRIGIFILVYSLFVGIPLFIEWQFFGSGKWLLPTAVSIFFASIGTLICLYVQRKAENRLLQDQRDNFAMLKRALMGIYSIKDLNLLLKKLIDVLKEKLKIADVRIYLIEISANAYLLKEPEGMKESAPTLKLDSAITQRLTAKKYPLVYEEMQLLSCNQSLEDQNLNEIVKDMDRLKADIIVPIMRVDDLLAGFIILGRQYQKKVYSEEEIDNLSVIGNESALAIENAIFYEESGRDWTQRAHDSRLRTMGEMGTGIAHQIRNRLNAISSQLILLQDIQNRIVINKSIPEDFIKMRKEFNSVAEAIFRDIEHGDEIVEAIKNYSKYTEAKPQVVVLEQAVSGAMRLLQLSRKNIEFKLFKDYDMRIKLWVNFSMLQDMFYNVFDNSNDAVILKQEEIKVGGLENQNEDFKLVVSTNLRGNMCEILIADNGMGIKKEHLEEGKGVNTMYFTTKNAEKGLGMGLALMRQFVKYSGGLMKVESEYTQWTKITIALPLATEEQKKLCRFENGGLDD